MTKYQQFSGKALYVGGKLAMSTDCCCDLVQCVHCIDKTSPFHCSLTLAGVADRGACPNCSAINGTYDLGLEHSPLSSCCLCYSEQQDCGVGPDWCSKCASTIDFILGTGATFFNITLTYAMVAGQFVVAVYINPSSTFDGDCDSTTPTVFHKSVTPASNPPDCRFELNRLGTMVLNTPATTRNGCDWSAASLVINSAA